MVGGTILSLGALLLFYRLFIYSPVIFGLRDDFKSAVPFQKVPAGIPGIRAKDCALCHREIYEEWQTSIHAKAFTDPFFQAFRRKDKQIWVCLNCHTPLDNQQPFKMVGLKGGSIERPITKENPEYDPEFQQEGISCAGCHLRDGVIWGPFKDLDAPHPTGYDPRFRTNEICYTCHQVPSGPFQFYNGGPCATFFEFEEGPYAARGYTCSTCHMPEVERSLVPGGPVRKTRRHLWPGGHVPEMLRQAITVEVTPSARTFSSGETAEFILTLTNSGAGHKIPTGDPDRFFTVEFTVMDKQGKVLKEQSHTISRRLIWWPLIVEYYDNRIGPLESRDFSFRYPLPEESSELMVRTRVRYHIMKEKTNRKLRKKYGLTGEDPYVFDLVEQSISLFREKGSATWEIGITEAIRIAGGDQRPNKRKVYEFRDNHKRNNMGSWCRSRSL